MSSDAGVTARTVPLGADDPRELGSYQLLSKLGQGGMGTVYLGRSQQGRYVAIKVIRADVADDSEFRARFRLEAETARRVARVCTAEVLDADPDAPQPYLVTEFIEGETLSRFVARNGPLADANLEQLAVGVAAALTAIHRAGIVHRDLKPSNVVLSPFGPRVIDFGIARALDAATNLTGDLQQLGTPAFMSPEQIEGGTVTPAVDIWAWGGVVTYAATGRYPFGDGNAQVLLYRALHEEPRLDGVDPALHPIVWHAMRKNPTTRPTAQQLMLRLLGDSGEDADATIDPREVTNVLQGWNLPVPGSGPAEDGPTMATTAGTQGPAGYSSTEAPTRLPTGVGSRPGAQGGFHPQAGGPTPPAQGGDTPGTGGTGGAPAKKRRTPVIVGAAAAVAAVVVAATLIATSGGDDSDDSSTASSGSAPASGGAASGIPQAATPLDLDTMVFASDQNGNYDLFTGRVPPAQGELADIKPITTAAENDMLPSISKDRRTVVFFRKGSPNALYAVAADGSGSPVKLFTSGPAAKLTIADDARPSLSPDGKFLVVRSTTDESGFPNPGLYVVSLDGSGLFRLGAKPQATDPAWSPSGELIAYWSSETESDRGFIVTIPARPDSQPTPITNGQGNRDADPTFSPDGKRIAFSREVDGDLEIYQMNTDGSQVERVTAEPGRDQDPAYSPDGKLLSFTGERGTPLRRVYLTDPADTTAADRLLTSTAGFHIRWASG
ncbi:eukaryotic-like serine/threonine-protein kinase [Frankia sp. Hr75.2]|nr:eukaryotic-like serine/threonine-protein kinase [Frankia sp. Hr75.2]